MARGRNSGKKSGSKPTTSGSRRSERQDIKERYAVAREDAQLAGIIPTTPEGAVRSEVANTFGHAYDGLPELVKQAIQENWATPDKAKPAILAALLEPFFKTQTVIDIDGKPVEIKPSPAILIGLANTLRMLDVVQYERDHPELAGKAKGGTQVNNNNIVANGEVFSDIDKMTKSVETILHETNIETVGDVSTNGHDEPLDETKSNNTKEEPEANRLPNVE